MKHIRISKLISVLLFLLPVLLAAQITGMQNYGVAQGLSQGNVTCLAQDRQGFLWVGTNNGLNRFDGYSFRKFQNNPHDTSSLSSNFIYALTVDSSGKIWIGTENGIDIYDPYVDRITHFKAYRPAARSRKTIITRMCFVHPGLLLVCTDVGFATVDIASGKNSAYLGMIPGTPDYNTDNITSVFVDGEKNVWLGADDGCLLKWIPGQKAARTVIKMNCDAGGSGQTITGIQEHDGNTLILSTDCGIRFFDKTSEKFVDYLSAQKISGQLCNCSYTNVLKLNEDQFCILLIRRIVLLDFKNHVIRDLINNEADDDMNFTNYRELLSDRQGLIWIGDYGKGIFCLNPDATHFGLITADPVIPNHLKNPDVLSFCEKGDSVLIGTSWGIDIMNIKTGKVSDYVLFPGKDAGDFPVNVVDMENGGSDDTWFFARSSVNGLAHLKLSTGEKKIFAQNEGLFSLKCVGICKRSDGTLWLATRDNGVEIFNPADAKTTSMVHDSVDLNSLSSNRVNSIFEDTKGKMWVATDKGLNSIDMATKKVKRYMLDPGDTLSISSDDVMGVAEDMKGTIWVATNYGFGKLDESTGKFSNYSSKDGLPDNFVNAILPDSLGFLWISTNKGLCRFDPQKKIFKIYSMEDGLQGPEFNENAMLYGKSGLMYFGGVNGFNYFNPHLVRENSVVPPVYITAMQVYDRPFHRDSSIVFKNVIHLNHTQNFISFDFVALNFYMPGRNKYACMLEGVDDDWIDLGDRRTMSYSNLAPGEYVFHVKACNNDGIWNEKGATLTIIIRPPFWKTKWFYTLCALFIIFSVWYYIRRRERRLCEEKIVLEKKVEERTTELRHEKEKLAEAHKDISDSITYARRIQATILPGDDEWKKMLPDAFVLYYPRDVVSGDFFWLHKAAHEIFVAAADCTGHGVPGAFMSMIGHTHLNEIVEHEKIYNPAAILNRLHVKVSSSLRQDSGSETRDGMDIALVSIDQAKNTLHYSGANRPLMLLHDGGIEEIKPDKLPIGGGADVGERNFKDNAIELKKGMMIYLFSDGFADQFGGSKGKKFGTKQLKELLLRIWTLPVNEQRKALDDCFLKWKGDLHQVDDVLVIGIRI